MVRAIRNRRELSASFINFHYGWSPMFTPIMIHVLKNIKPAVVMIYTNEMTFWKQELQSLKV